MPDPWDLTVEQARAEGKRLRPRLEEADRIASSLFAEQIKDYDFVVVELGPPAPPTTSRKPNRRRR